MPFLGQARRAALGYVVRRVEPARAQQLRGPRGPLDVEVALAADEQQERLRQVHLRVPHALKAVEHLKQRLDRRWAAQRDHRVVDEAALAQRVLRPPLRRVLLLRRCRRRTRRPPIVVGQLDALDAGAVSDHSQLHFVDKNIE